MAVAAAACALVDFLAFQSLFLADHFLCSIDLFLDKTKLKAAVADPKLQTV
jgi:hypothetical protein